MTVESPGKAEVGVPFPIEFRQRWSVHPQLTDLQELAGPANATFVPNEDGSYTLAPAEREFNMDVVTGNEDLAPIEPLGR